MKTICTAASAALMTFALASTALAADPLKVWMRYGDNEKNVLDKITKDFTAKTGIEIDLFLANTDFETRLARAAVGGSLPDVVVNDATAMGQMLDMGILKEIDRSAIQGSDQLYDVAWQSVQSQDGKYYGVPTSAQAFAVFIRKDWREKLGYDVPKTWDELYELAKAFTEKDPDGNGKADTYGYVMPVSATRGYASWFLSDLIWQAGGEFLAKKENGYTSSLGTPEVAKAVSFARDFICNGYAQPSAITATTGDATPVFSSGQAGIYRSGPYHLAPFSKEPGRDKIEVVAPPAGPAGQAELAEGEAAFITVSSTQDDAARQFIEYLISAEGQENGMAVGIDSSPIVRLPVNKTVNVAEVQPDKAWAIYADLYGKSGHYFPRVPNWKPIRQLTADGFNKILSDCSSDIAAGLAATDETVNAELANQGVKAD
ncbi:ABC transporter substrate-binding protein [Roseibium litorale]|uniref:Sugar ABC transporter substrate-binding protein n=1 Tax=Roseibium litorale TaxID=2803841 RepID=A0ABR9CP57_9HYPH|nr:sugar ABC transporter substrate-binding protein [Roseibium litorale]MBD8892210.1 sugar ABC transporter substrate-binding protein [Roseibium litorale]